MLHAIRVLLVMGRGTAVRRWLLLRSWRHHWSAVSAGRKVTLVRAAVLHHMRTRTSSISARMVAMLLHMWKVRLSVRWHGRVAEGSAILGMLTGGPPCPPIICGAYGTEPRGYPGGIWGTMFVLVSMGDGPKAVCAASGTLHSL